MAITFDEALAATGLPEAALKPIRDKWNEAFNLVLKNNERVAQINAAKAQDPNNTEYIDSLWKLHAKNDPKLSETEAKFDAIAEQYEELLKQLREFGRTKVPTPLSEEDAKNVRKAVNESSETISKAIAGAAAMVTVVDAMLGVSGNSIDGGLISLMPEVDSLKNTRGRKAGTSTTSYATRIGGFEIDGRNIHRDGKANFRYAADSLSTEFGAENFPENKVTGEEIEEAYFAAIEKPFRSVKTADTTKTFDFTKSVKVSDNATETRTVSLTVKAKEAETTANAPVEAPKAESVNQTDTTNVPENKSATSGPVKSAPAKKTAAPTKK
jgi:hypothetical protein